MINNDEKWMKEALKEAEKAFARNEVPVGSILVFENRIISRASNSVEANCDASKHAELICLQEGASEIGNWRLHKCTLYSTLEPCAMCAGAMILFRLKKVVYGAPDYRHGAIEILEKPHEIHRVKYVGGVLVEESQELMKKFFKNLRQSEKNALI